MYVLLQVHIACLYLSIHLSIHLCVCVCMKLFQLCLTLCDLVDYGLPGSSVHGILQARILEWLPCLPPGDFPNPGIELKSPGSPALASGFFTASATREAHLSVYHPPLHLSNLPPSLPQPSSLPPSFLCFLLSFLPPFPLFSFPSSPFFPSILSFTQPPLYFIGEETEGQRS